MYETFTCWLVNLLSFVSYEWALNNIVLLLVVVNEKRLWVSVSLRISTTISKHHFLSLPKSIGD